MTPARRFLVAALVASAASGAIAQQPARIPGGNGTLYIGGYPNLVYFNVADGASGSRRA